MRRTVADMVAEYNLLRAKSKLIKSEMDKLAKDIKAYLTSNVTPDSKGNYYEENDSFVYGNQAKKSVKLNEDRAKVFFQERNLLEEVSEVKVVLNEDKISKALEEGKITQEELEALVDIKVTYSIDIKEKEKQEEEVYEIPIASSVKPVKKKLPTRRL